MIACLELYSTQNFNLRLKCNMTQFNSIEETVKSMRNGASNSGWEMEPVTYLAKTRSVKSIAICSMYYGLVGKYNELNNLEAVLLV